METRKRENSIHKPMKRILELIEQNGHVCVDDFINNKDTLKSIKEHISKQYRQPEENYNIDFLRTIMLKLREEEYSRTNNELYNVQRLESINTKIEGLQVEIEKLQSSIYELYINDSNEYKDNISKKLFLNNVESPEIHEQELHLKGLQVQKEKLQKEASKIQLNIKRQKSTKEHHIKEIEKLQQVIESYLNLAYIESPDKKLYFFNDKYKITFVDSPDILQRELIKIRDYKNGFSNRSNNKFKSIKKMDKYKQYIFNLRYLSRSEILSESELHQCFPIINKFLKWENALHNEVSNENYVSFFRGHSNSNFLLKPSINRNINYKRNEHLMYREIQINNANEIRNVNEVLEKLTTMQHYSLPTRLLDITTSVLTALYFTIEDNKEKDGEIIIYKVNEKEVKYFDSDSVEIQSALVLLSYKDKMELLKVAIESTLTMMFDTIQNGDSFEKYEMSKAGCISNFNKEKIVKRLSHEIQKNSGHLLEDIYPLDLLTSYFVKPKQNNVRIVKQQGAFIINGLIDSTEVNNKNRIVEVNTLRKNNNINEVKQLWKDLSSSEYPFLNQNKEKIVKYIITSSSKKDFKQWLADLSVDASAIYPDFEKIAGYLKDKYL